MVLAQAIGCLVLPQAVVCAFVPISEVTWEVCLVKPTYYSVPTASKAVRVSECPGLLYSSAATASPGLLLDIWRIDFPFFKVL